MAAAGIASVAARCRGGGERGEQGHRECGGERRGGAGWAGDVGGLGLEGEVVVGGVDGVAGDPVVRAAEAGRAGQRAGGAEADRAVLGKRGPAFQPGLEELLCVHVCSA